MRFFGRGCSIRMKNVGAPYTRRLRPKNRGPSHMRVTREKNLLFKTATCSERISPRVRPKGDDRNVGR